MGVELRIPIGGGIRARNDLAAARISEEKALRTFRDTENQILNAIDTALKKAASRREGIQSYQTIVTFSQNLLNTQLERLKVGRVESRKVLEVKADLPQARQGVTEPQVQYRRPFLGKELVEGS